MKRIYIRKPGHDTGRVYKSKSSVLDDKVAILGYIGFVTMGLISEDEWRVSQQKIVDRFNLTIVETSFDGRGKVAKNTPYFSWRAVLGPNKTK